MDNSETNIDLIVRSDIGMTALVFARSNGHKDDVHLITNEQYRDKH